MAIALDTTTESNSTSFSHICTGSNLILLLWVATSGGFSNAVTGINYNGVAMTQITSQGGYGGNMYLFKLLNPTIGSNTVDITLNGSFGIYSVSASYTGTADIDSFNSDVNSGSGTITVATTVVASNCWLVGMGAGFGSGVSSVSLNRTTRQNGSMGTNLGAGVGDSNGTVSSGSQSIIYTTNTGTAANLAAITASIKTPPPSQISKISGVAQASISKVSLVSNINIKKVSGVSN